MILFQVDVQEESDIIIVRQKCREAAQNLKFGIIDQTRIITAASELSRNIFEYASKGKVIIEQIFSKDRQGISLTFEDEGPGIENIELAMKSGYSKSDGLGLGLPGSQKLMDEFYISSIVGRGTKVIIKKWL
ncbi:anti-sigma regulatory factor [Clostridium sp. WILCCON 0269]|uniref:Anti-sigma regulatory factor n=1 Tax=Candidatus Clostridium eludens TaxID=3381663 RepID=A0ABW8SJD5_9CLOT